MSLDLARARSGASSPALLRDGGLLVVSPSIALFAVLFLAALVPVLATPIPAMVDYTNHLARMYLLANPSSTAASPFYRLASAFYPNLAMDLAVPPMARLLGVELATRIFLLITQVMVVTGALAIEFAVKRRFGISGFCALLMLYSTPFAWGFLNFEFGLAVALWGIAAWLGLRERPMILRFAMHALFVAALLVSHLFALGLYGFTLGVHELWSARRRTVRATVEALTLLAAPALVAASFMAAAGAPIGRSINTWDFLVKPMWPFFLLNGYSVIGSALASIVLLALLHALISRRALSFAQSGRWLLPGFFLLFVAVPARLRDTAFVDIRVLVAAALIVPAFVEVNLPPGSLRRGAMTVMAGLILASAGLTTWVWTSYKADYSALIGSFSRLDKGARILVGGSGAAADPPMTDLIAYPMYHAPTLAVHYADAFVPTLFTTVGKQPIVVTPRYQGLAYSCSGPVPSHTLVAVARHRPDPDTPRFVRSWPKDFDYLYVVGEATENPLPDLLETMQVDQRFTLYRIRKSDAKSARPG